MKNMLLVILTAVFISAHAQNNSTNFQMPEGLKLPAKYQKYFDNRPNQMGLNKNLALPSAQAQKATNFKKAVALKAINEVKNLLDSIITIDTTYEWSTNSKQIYTYDNNGNESSNTSLYWNSTSNTWVNNSKNSTTYDKYGNSTSYTYQNWNTTSNTWDNNDRDLYSYDDLGKMLSYGYQDWDTTSKSWIYTYQSSYFYRANGKDSMMLHQRWDKNSNEWVNSYRNLYVLDDDGFIIRDTTQNWSSGSQRWVNQSVSFYINDSQGNKLKRNTQAYDTISKTWNDSGKEFLSYYNNGKLYSDTVLAINNNTHNWDTSFITLYNEEGKTLKFIFFGGFKILGTYDIDGKDSTITFQTWDSNSKDWLNYNYTYYTYNGNGDKLNGYTYSWDTNSKTWVRPTTATYYYSLHTIIKKVKPTINWSNPDDITYGTLLSDTQLNAQADVAGTFTYTPAAGTKLEVGDNQKLLVHFEPQDTAQYLSTSDSVYIKVLSVTGTPVLQNHTINVYPNPVVNTLYIANTQGEITYSIFDLTGKVVASGKTNNHQIDIPSLAQGIYTIKISNKQGSLTGRFVKQ
jgi:hypothetical protein